MFFIHIIKTAQVTNPKRTDNDPESRVNPFVKNKNAFQLKAYHPRNTEITKH